MSTSSSIRHLVRWLLLSIAVLGPVLVNTYAAQPALTQIQDILYRADGTTAHGTLIVSWPDFTTTDKQFIAAGSKTIPIGSDGSISLSLASTTGTMPAGVTYKIVAKFDDGTTATEYWSVPATPTTTIAAMRILPSTTSSSIVSQALISGKLDRAKDTPVVLGDVRYASAFPGATVTNKLDSSIADCGTAPCVVVAQSSLDSGAPTSLSDNAVLVDERQSGTMNSFGLPDQGQHNGILWQRKITSTKDGWDGYSTGQFYFEAAKGGHNYWNGSSGSKNSYYSLGGVTVSRTVGQVMGTQWWTSNYGSGDTVGSAYFVRRYGGTLTNGDEGLEPIRLDAGSGDSLFTATVGSVDANTITFTSSRNAYTLGETRLLINRNAAKQHQVSSCSVDNVNSMPPTITCTGTTLTTWYGETGTKTNVCFELASNKVDEFNRTLRVRSIQSDTKATLDLTYQGYDASWDRGSVGIPSSGAATFSYCSPVADASQWSQNKVTVSDPTVFAANDAIEQNIASEQSFQGMSLLYYPSVWPVTRTSMISMNNAGSKNGGTSTIPMYSFLTAMGKTQYLWDYWNGSVAKGGTNWHNQSTTPPQSGWFLAYSDNTSGCESLLGTRLSDFSNNTWISYCRDASDGNSRGWNISGHMKISEDGRAALSSNGWTTVTGAQFFLVATGTNSGYVSHSTTTTSTGSAFKAENSSTAGWQVDFQGNAKHFNGAKLTLYSDGGTTSVASIDGSNGTAMFAKVCYNSAQTLCDFAGAGAPQTSCVTGSTYRRSDGGAGSTFYVCESSQWAAK